MCDTPHVNPLGVPLLKVGRDVHGRFRPGNPGGPGNPFARKVASLRKALLDSVNEQDIRDMVEHLKQQARQGDRAAIKLILQYCVGKPEPAKDPDRMDADEWDRLRQMSVGHKEFTRTMETIPACLACDEAEDAWPCNAQEGPLAHSIKFIHSHLRAAGQPPAESASPTTAPDSARPDAASSVPPGAPTADRTGEASAPTAAPRPSAAKGTTKPSDRREPTGGSRRDRRPLTSPPSPNGGNEGGQRQAPEPRPRPSRTAGQSVRKPPRG